MLEQAIRATIKIYFIENRLESVFYIQEIVNKINLDNVHQH